MRSLFLWLLLAPALHAEGLKLHIYHTNDIHGWIFSRPAGPREKEPGRPQPRQMDGAARSIAEDAGRLVGGAAALAKVYRADPGPKLLLDAGDWFQGTPEGTLTKGKALADVFNAIPYDAVAVGNHDFDFGEERLKALAREIKIPVLGANVRRAAGHDRVDYLRPWIVKEVAGVKIGIFGLLTTRMGSLTFERNFTGLEFRREVDEARAAVKELRGKGASVIIAVTHMGLESPQGAPFEGDMTLATEVEGIDVIVGGHTHTPLFEPIRDATYGTLITQAGSELSRVGLVELVIDAGTGRAAYAQGRLIDLWVDETGEDPAVLQLVGAFQREAGKTMDVIVATASAALIHDRRASVESPLGDWLTDCERSWAKTDVAFQNPGGIRADLAAGPVTLRALFDIMPFDNRVVKLKMSGKLIREVLERGAGGPGMIQVSGLKAVYDRSRPRGNRIISIKIDGKDMDPGAVYGAAAVDFMVQGGDGYTPFSQALETETTDMLLRDVLGWCAERSGSIAPGPLDRLTPKGD